jgi:hypothetical protein
MLISFLLSMTALTAAAYLLLTLNELEYTVTRYDPTLRIARDMTGQTNLPYLHTRYNTELMYRMAPDELVDLADHLLPSTPILGVPPRGFSKPTENLTWRNTQKQ